MPGLTIDAEMAILKERLRVLREEHFTLIDRIREIRDDGRLESEEGLALIRALNQNILEKGRYRNHLTWLQNL